MISLLLRSISRISLIALCSSTVAQVATGRHRALLIGIDHYRMATPAEISAAQPTLRALGMVTPENQPPVRDWQELDGAVKDTQRLALVLPKFGFTDIQTISDEKATRDAILNAIRQLLITGARDGDVLLLYYSGHGSQMRNSLSATKADLVDETLVPWDANVGFYDVRDKELARLFNEAMAAHKVTITAIFDSCHSGTMVRGPRTFHAKTEPIDPRDARDPYGAKKGEEPPETHGALILTATRFDQTAQEAYDDQSNPPGSIDGAYTIALLRTLQNVQPSTPAIEVEHQIEANFRALSEAAANDPDGPQYQQTPAMVGTPERKALGLFGDAAK